LSAAIPEVAFLAGKPSSKTVSLTGAGATYTGADLPCDFCTGRTNTVATHIATGDSADGPVAGQADLFSKHNMTPTGANTGEICAFCHTPQGDESKVTAPQWNRTLTTLSSYRSFASLGSATEQATGSISMACLACHDGSQAPNIAINTPTLQLDSGNVDVMIGEALRNHHPVGIEYAGGGQNQYAPEVISNPKAAYDRLFDMSRFTRPSRFENIYLVGKFRKSVIFSKQSDINAFGDVLTFSNEGSFNKEEFNKSTYSGTGSGTVWWVKSPNSKIGRQKTDLYLFTRTDMIDSIPDESTLNRPYVECATCHDPHSTNPTFLRMPGGNARSQICLTCHNK
jgi:predicted CXXCH cytochrome family protein